MKNFLFVFLLFFNFSLYSQTKNELVEHSRSQNKEISQLGENDYVYYLGPNSYLDYKTALKDFPEKADRIKVLNVTGIKHISIFGGKITDDSRAFLDRMFDKVDLSTADNIVLKRHLMYAVSVRSFLLSVFLYLEENQFKGNLSLSFYTSKDGALKEIRKHMNKSLNQSLNFNIVYDVKNEGYSINDRLTNTHLYKYTYPYRFLGIETLSRQQYIEGAGLEKGKASKLLFRCARFLNFI